VLQLGGEGKMVGPQERGRPGAGEGH
jgi:hypothetical protein